MSTAELNTEMSRWVRRGTLMSKSGSTTLFLPMKSYQDRSWRLASTTTTLSPAVWMSSLIRESRSRLACRTASTTTSGRSDAVIVTRPEKFFRRKEPPGSILKVWLTCSVSSTPHAAAGMASAQTASSTAMVRMRSWTKLAPQTFGIHVLPRRTRRSPRKSCLLSLRARRSNVFYGVRIQRARVDGHADDGVDAQSVESVDLPLGGDAAGGGQ